MAIFISHSIPCGGTVEEDKALINPKKDRMREIERDGGVGAISAGMKI